MAIDYGLKYDKYQVISGSAYLFRSGAIADSSTAISASSNQIIAITCSANFNNRLTKLTSVNANATITITSGSSNKENLQNDTKLILRYYSGSKLPTDRIVSSSESTLDHLLGGIGTNVSFIDIPLLNDDDSFTVAYKTVRALTASVGHNRTFKAALVDDGSTFQPSSSLGENMTIGSSFRIRSSPTYTLPNDYLLSSSGFFTITSLNSGSVATPDFSGTEVQVDGMQVGTSLMVGGGSGSQAFAHNLIQTGSGLLNQEFFEGFPIPTSSSIGLTLDPEDKTSGVVTGSGETRLYLSSSGRVGINTVDPITDVDIRANEFQIQRTQERRGLRINPEGNIESFDKTAGTATTGSEFILNYSRGVTITKVLLEEFDNRAVSYDDDAAAVDAFNGFSVKEQNRILQLAEASGFITPPSVGDTIGSIRWVTESGSAEALGKRTAGEQANIKAVVNTVGDTGVSSDLVFGLASQTGGAAQVMVLDGSGVHQLTGSIIVTGDIQATSLNVTSITSSIVTSSIVQTYGSNIFGDAASDSQTFNGDITASGDISSSGTITAATFNLGGGSLSTTNITASGLIRSSGSIVHGNVSASGNIVASGFISASGRLQTLSHITASGNISSSGNIIGTINGGKF
ncbi:hypothetical protein [uncultured virus]|uniref:Uncharacterized protein n=1 Tax=uncultured virus TaxID=340016 RepID=A0A218ML78_9VIRU|nr:hypothetical protein [uncultured virus]|tara:strand:+ start:82 stop:1971 length:1890 start_codon:yes stop_codon:yes gene_type:complete